MKKLLTLVLALVMCLGCMSVSFAETDVTWNINNDIFPLAEPVTFKITTCGYDYQKETAELANNKDFMALCEATNVYFEFDQIKDTDVESSRRNIETRLLNGDYGDAFWGFGYEVIATSDVLDMAASGIAVDIMPYVENGTMPNFAANISTDLMKNFKATDGGIYTLRNVNQVNAYQAGEGLLMGNQDWIKQWMDATGETETPATIEKFEEMLIYFRDNDMNGNGDASDEIPYFFTSISWGGNMTFEHGMSPWGIATKDTAMDKNIMIGDDQQVYFAHTTQAYKDALITFNRWFEEGLIYQDAFTANNDTNTAIYNEAAKNIGLYNAAYESAGFEAILPPSAEGYETRVFMHPTARTGVDNPDFIVTDKCENPEILLAFMDLIYEPLNTLIWRYGTTAFDPEGYAATNNPESHMLISVNEEGKYVFQRPESEDCPMTVEEVGPWAFVQDLGAITFEIIDQMYDATSFIGDNPRTRGYLLYDANGIWNPTECIWGRFAILDDDQEDLNFYYNEISSITAEYRAKFITGEWDIEEKWDEFQQKLQDAGVEEMRDIIQRAYDAFLAL